MANKKILLQKALREPRKFFSGVDLRMNLLRVCLSHRMCDAFHL